MGYKTRLRRELEAAGAQASEVGDLVKIAGQLRQLEAPSRRYSRTMALVMASLTGVLVGSAMVAYAQTAMPGNWLYSVKRTSENIAVAADPGYRATLMMRRSLEVKELVAQRAGPARITATLASYRAQAAAYKSQNYAAFEYCKANLQQAATKAAGPTRTAINNTLATIPT